MHSWGLRYGELVGRWAARRPHRPAVVTDDATLSYAELAGRIRSLTRVLRAHGVTPGDRVLCVSENRPEMLVLAFACARAGAVFVPVNPASTPDELRFVLADATPAVVCVGSAAESFRSGAVPAPPPVVDLDTLGPGGVGPEGTADDADRPADVGPDDAAVICYTSGTTGHPKGVVLTHASLHWNSVNTLLGLDIGADDVALVTTPLFHVAALNMLAVNTLYKGATLVLRRRFDPVECLETIAAERVTVTFAVPTMLAMLERSPGFDPARLASLRWVLSGGAPLPPETAARWSARGIPVIASYGLSEAGPSVTFRRIDEVGGKPGSSGSPAPLTEVRIVDGDGRPLPDGTAGEIVVSGRHVAAGYWNAPEATRAAFRADGLHTGDRGYLDPDGDLVVVGRIKDTIITGGENVDPVEVEQALLAHDAVEEAVVVGLPDDVWGERIVVVVVPTSGATVDLDGIRTFLAGRLAGHKHPRRVELWPAVPKSTVGKLLRGAVRDRLLTEDPPSAPPPQVRVR